MDYKITIAGIFVGFAALEILGGQFLNRSRSTAKDVIIELGAGILLPVLVVPLILFASAGLTEWLVPGSAGALVDWPWWGMLLILLLADDLTQYWWHRLSHTLPWLYALHRAHHSGAYMSVRIVYRNNLLYYAFMPGIWLTGVLLYLGFLPVYFYYIIVKMTVIIGAHSSVAWDEPLYRFRLTRPLMFLLERIISTPATHSAHHGLNLSDDATHYKGNYGNLFFFWDVLFGTAKITRRRPLEFGIEKMPEANWFQELIWPAASSMRPRSD